MGSVLEGWCVVGLCCVAGGGEGGVGFVRVAFEMLPFFNHHLYFLNLMIVVFRLLSHLAL